MNPFKQPLLETDCTAQEERSAIMQYDGRFSQKEAELLAAESTRKSAREWEAHWELMAFRRGGYLAVQEFRENGVTP